MVINMKCMTYYQENDNIFKKKINFLPKKI